MSPEFVPLVTSAFASLMDEFGFEILDESEDQVRSFYWGAVRLGSAATVLDVIVDRGLLGSPTIGRREDLADFGPVALIPFDRIYEFQAISARDRRQLASRDRDAIIRVFRKSIEPKLLELRSLEMADGDFDSVDLQVEHELQVYARLIVKYAEQYLRGEFSNWPELCEYVWHWLIASEFANERSWGEELTLENVERRFSKLQSYIEHLRRESV